MSIETLGELAYLQVQTLLDSSHEFHEVNNIPMRTARWDTISRPMRLTLDMAMLPVNQGHLGIGHGGLIAALLDDTAGFAAVAWAAEQGKTVLGKELRRVRFLKPFPMYTFVRAVGYVDRVSGSTVYSRGFVMRLDSHQLLAEAELTAKLVSKVRVP